MRSRPTAARSSVLYADSSALVRAYLDDEEEHQALRLLLLGGDEGVVSSEVSRLELTSAVRSAERAGRIADGDELLDWIDMDCGVDGPIQLLGLRTEPTLAAARRLLLAYPLRTMDAIHLAVALEDAPHYAGDGEVVLVTRDAGQAAAARALGLAVL